MVPRPAGSLVQHPSNVLHGVTCVTEGTRKSLFVVDDKLGVPTYTKDFAESILKHIEEDLPYGLYNMVSQGEASRYETALAINEYLNLGLTINKVDSDYFKTEYFAPRPYSEKLINKSLNDLLLNTFVNPPLVV